LSGMKRRIDQLLVDRGFAETRHKAQGLLLAGQVLVGNEKVEKPGQMVDPESGIRILQHQAFASRAGAKLEAALDHFGISVAGRACADLGASTGGFTDCLLQRGALRVHAFDVGRGQLAWKLRSDPRVIVRDRCNVRELKSADLPEVTFVSIDLSFISVRKVLPALKEALSGRAAEIVVLVKPQFEVGKGEVGKGGIVRDEAKRRRALEEVAEFALRAGFRVAGRIESPVPGAAGNREFLLYLELPIGLLS